MPFLQTGLDPKRVANNISITYNWSNAAPLTIESEVTSIIAELCNTIPGIKSISTYSRTNSGGITLEFIEEKNMDAARMEVSSMLRRVQSKLPDNLSTFNVSGGNLFSESESVLSYSLFSTFQEESMEYLIEERIKRPVSAIKGVNEVQVSGLNKSQWEICCDDNRLKVLGLSLKDVIQVIQESFGEAYLGNAGIVSNSGTGILHIPVYEQMGNLEMPDWDQIILKTKENHLIGLNEIADISYKTILDYGSFRINGLSTLRVTVLADKDANIIQVGKDTERIIDELKNNLPEGYTIRKEIDATTTLKEELRHIYYRTALSFVILLIFISLVSRAPRYIFVVFFSLIATLTISVAFFYLLGIQINLYSLAGITVSFGIIIDNIIVMQDHLLLRKDMKGFSALLAATFTTIGALSVIFMLDDQVRLKLEGFASVFTVTLCVSLFSALFLVPALTNITHLTKNRRGSFRRNSRVHHWIRFLEKTWLLLRRRKGWIVAVLILAFGLPIFQLPDQVAEKKEEDETRWYHQLYNKTLGSDFYGDKMKKYIDIGMGGTLRLFIEKKGEGRYYYRRGEEAQESKINIYGKLEMGSSKEMTNMVAMEMEQFLNKFEEISMYTTNINGNNINIRVEFATPFQFDFKALMIKNEVVGKCISLGGASWRVYGSGDVFQGDRPFSNDILGMIGYQNNKIELKGYDLGMLYELAEWIKTRLGKNGRFQDISIASQVNYRTPREYTYTLEPRREAMQNTGITAGNILELMSNRSSQGDRIKLFTGKDYEEVNITTHNAKHQDIWNLMSTMEQVNGQLTSPGDLLDKSFHTASNTIRREDGQYLINVLYNFIGPNNLHIRIRDQVIEEVKELQPMGYSSAPTIQRWGGWGRDNEIKGQFKLFIYIILIIFFICSILLNSFKKPLLVIFMIPVSFIGLFIAFSIFDIRFDNGIFAAFVFTSGLSVNSALYIINEYNSLQKMRPNAELMTLYMAAFRHKIMPIIYTIGSTVLGLVPFILINKDQDFWYSFAIGTIAGLLFSLIGVFIYLPVFLNLDLQK